MRSVELVKHHPVAKLGDPGPDRLQPRTPTATVPDPPKIAGLAADIEVENYLTDLQDLAYLVYRYVDQRERAESEAEPDLMALLGRITKNLKHLAVIYTDCLQEAQTQFRRSQQEVQPPLDDFPQAIARLQRQLLKTDQQIRQYSESVTILTAAIERQIAFDTTLKNDAQRKARRTELMESDGDYIEAINALKAAQDQREALLIELQFLRNQFSVLKLSVREAIANKELAVFEAA